MKFINQKAPGNVARAPKKFLRQQSWTMMSQYHGTPMEDRLKIIIMWKICNIVLLPVVIFISYPTNKNISSLIGMFLLHFTPLTNIFHLCWMLSLVIVCIVIKAKNVLLKKIECGSDLIRIKFGKLWGSSGFSEGKESSEHNWANI